MHRARLTLTALLLGAFLAAGGQWSLSQTKETKTLKLKLLLPQSDASVKVGTLAVKGEGEERTIKVKVPADKDTVVVSVMWEPNNYTKITRKKTISTKEAEVEVDLRKGDPKSPDDIVVRFVPTPDDVVDHMCKM